KAFQPVECRREVFIHPFWGFAAARARKANGPAMRKAHKQLLIRNIHEQDSIDTMRGESLHDIGGTGKVVAVIGEQQFFEKFGHYSLPFPNFAREAASSGRSAAYVSSGTPATAASQACCTARTPAAGPPGWLT